MKVKKSDVSAEDCLNDIENGNSLDYSYDLIVCGLLDTYKSQVEIWYAGKKILKLKLKDLNNDFLLFPLYQTVQSVFDCKKLCKGVYLQEGEVGLIASYEARLPNFNIDRLSFHMVDVTETNKNFNLLHAVNYDGLPLKLTPNRDTLLTFQILFVRG